MIGYDQVEVMPTRFIGRYMELKDLAIKCGCNETPNLSKPGEFYGEGDGYHMQQSASEIAGLVAALEPYGPFNSVLDIGIGAGGTTRFMAEQLKHRHVWVVDNMSHPSTELWKLNRHRMPCPVTEIVGDSKDPETWSKLREHDTLFDLVGIDGLHTTDYVVNDIKLAITQMYPGTVVWFHDIELPDVKIVWEQMCQANPVIYRGVAKQGTMGIGALVFMGSLGFK